MQQYRLVCMSAKNNGERKRPSHDRHMMVVEKVLQAGVGGSMPSARPFPALGSHFMMSLQTC